MKQKTIALLLAIALIVCIMPYFAGAEVAPPTALSAPEHFGVSHYSGAYVEFSFSAPNDLRNYIEKRAADDPENKQNFSVYYQVDYKIDGGSWHHTSEWDSPDTVPDKINKLYFTFISEKKYFQGERHSMTALFPQNEALKAFTGWDYFKEHSITFLTRIAHSFDNGKTYVLSPWSNEYILSATGKLEYNQLINHAPSIISADLKTTASGEPYFDMKIEKIPGEVADLHSASGGSVRTEVWMRRVEDKDFKYIEYEWADSELLNIEASDYFSVDNSEQSYEAEGYEIKIRYALDLKKYKQSGYSSSGSAVDIYSPFSNVISHNMPAWSNASSWATSELKKADNEGLIPDILKGADLTKPITREEFAELAVKLYEKSTDKAAIPASPNPFPDTNNPEILKAYKLGVTTGISTAEGLVFSPGELINREQCATMLYRALKAIVPGGEYSIAGIKDFPDQKDISSWAVEGTKYLAKLGIIKGDNNGNFMPKAVTSAQEAAGYGAATREAAILMSVRSFEQIEAGTLGTPTGDNETTPPSGTITPSAPSVTITPPAQQNTSNDSVVGTWVLGNVSGGKFNSATGKYEGGAAGLGQIYNFQADGTYSMLVIWSNAMCMTGKYSVKDEVITLVNRVAQESNDDGMTWGAEEMLPDTSSYFTAGSDTTGKYLLIGEEGATPPLVDKSNALIYRSKVNEQAMNPGKTTETPAQGAESSQKSPPSIIGIWQSGGMIGHSYDVTIGGVRYNFGVGQQYVFKEDGTFISSIVSGYGNMVSITGTYTVKDDKITFSNQSGKVSNDYGDTWKEGNSPPDISIYYILETDDSENYLVIGMDDAVPPLNTETNAIRYFLIDE